MKNRWIVAACAAVCWTASAQTTAPYVPAPENLRARTEFQDAKFGIFLHWGLYSLLGTGEWTMTNRNINYQEYAKLANAFYPHDFDAAEWVSAIKSSGAGYVCFTTRHHDGFSMWDTAQTDYDIVDATPYKQDVVKALSDECSRQDIRAAPLLFADRLVPRRLPARAGRGLGRAAPARRSATSVTTTL